jgi:uncharacterized protein
VRRRPVSAACRGIILLRACDDGAAARATWLCHDVRALFLFVGAAKMPVSDLSTLLATLQPTLNGGVMVFCTLPADVRVAEVPLVGLFREAEGVTGILAEDDAMALGIAPLFRAAWITLSVRSDLQAVGLTAAVAGALSAAGISCNVVAAAHHDHLFVPIDAGRAALAVLERLQAEHAVPSRGGC